MKMNLKKFIGKTYDDVIIPPSGLNTVDSRSQVSLKTKFSRNIELNQPIIPANMLDITESEMAIATAFLGSIGIIHRFCPIDFQVQEIRKTKRAHNFIIDDPYKITPDKNLFEAKEVMRKHDVGSLLVEDGRNKLLGILTKRDIRFVDYSIKVRDRMTPFSQLITASPKMDLNSVMTVFVKTKVKKLPLVDKERNIVGLITSKDTLKLQKYPLSSLDKSGRLLVGASVGAVGDYLERSQELIKTGVDVIVIDITSGHSKSMVNAIKSFRNKFGDFELVVGNIGSAEQANALMHLDIDGLKIGVGPGGACTTRKSTGIGVPQLYAVLETYWNLVEKYKWKPNNIVPLNADGNIRKGADAFHALMAGASSVMVGSMFSATEETPGIAYLKEDGMYKRFRGMASTEALIARYEADQKDDAISEAMKKSPEGIAREVKIKGSAIELVNNLLGGLRSAITHRGASSLKEAKENFNPFNDENGFHILSEAGRKESYDR